MILDPSAQTVGYWDLAGRFPYRSAQGNQYIMITYHVDSNAILLQPLKKESQNRLSQRGQKQIIDSNKQVTHLLCI